MLAKGVRFNAQKRVIGKYFSTAILEFAMRCHYCTNRFVIRTDPEHCGYAVVSGCRKYRTDYTAQDAMTLELPSREDRQRNPGDAMTAVERHHIDSEFARKEAPRLAQLQQMREPWKNDSELNQTLRKRFREQKKDTELLGKLEKEKMLLPVSREDVMAARHVVFQGTGPTLRKIRKLQSESIFAKGNKG